MDDAAPRKPLYRVFVFVPVLLLLFGAVKLRQFKEQKELDKERNDAKNFVVHYQAPVGWKSTPHGPESLFREIDPKTGLILRGAANQVVDASNPTPDLTTDGIAKYFEDRTDENMPTWKATELAKAPGDGVDFAVLRRATKDRVVITAYAVRGNTTVLMTLFGKGKARNLVDSNLPVFYEMLKTVSLHEKDMSNL
jgi:hypothetical protein